MTPKNLAPRIRAHNENLELLLNENRLIISSFKKSIRCIKDVFKGEYTFFC